MRSGTAISDTIVVALKSEMKMLSAFRQHPPHHLRQRDAPQDQSAPTCRTARPASTLPCGMASMPARNVSAK